MNLSGQFGRKRQFRVPVIAADAPERIHDRPNHDSVDSERRISRRVAENSVEYGRTFDFLVPSSKLPVHALPHWLNTSRSRSSSPTDTSCWIADAFSFLRFANKGNFVGRAPIWYRLTPEFSDELFGGRGACLVSAEIEKNLEEFT